MSTPKYIVRCLFMMLAGLSLSAGAAESNLLSAASFEATAPGSEPGSPWKVRAKGEATSITVATPPGVDSGSWVRLSDRDAVEKVYMTTDIPAVSKGCLAFKLYFPDATGTLGIYLRSSELPKSENAVVEFKSVEGSGSLYVGAHGQREKLPVMATVPGMMDFEIEFEATEAGERIQVYINEAGTRNLIYRGSVPGGGKADSLMITTDTKTEATDIYVGDLRLTSES
ncbi:hypothetical protein H5P28_14365 [Ruficoccus amylovorans]|uniref:3-keto-disaccharide hydrolase domain-containing protein n=1 Tax=Ruficoccus amylovorans TaxID=1804625 RepID=A0A842HIV8_9BACT|nr:hypothetical protein [Ruficoccus amylovorans]MBC2595447.1 hypothetical protein [Ruficoccus amylovorans]